MCIIVDSNTFAPVFNPMCSEHPGFVHVLNWVDDQNNNAKFVYGGTTYRKELRQANKYLKIMKLLHDKGKVAEIETKKVDDYEKKLNKTDNCKSFNDKHIIAIVAISHCRLVCTNDTASHCYIKDTKYYPKKPNKVKPPKIYSGSNSRNLLSRRYIIKLKNVM